MSKSNIVSRKEEIRILDRVCARSEAALIAVYGRRRVGKTFLINEYFDNRFAFKVTGTLDQDTAFQLGKFREEMERKWEKSIPEIPTWGKAFSLLRDYLDTLAEEENKVIFFDEMPWLDTPKSDFLAEFSHFWNDYACARHHLVFVACGSSSLWMVKNLVEDKGNLFNRKAGILRLRPFNLAETERYLERIGIRYRRQEVATLYMIFGGIPYYLRFLDPSLTMTENVDALLFGPNQELRNEFSVLLRTLFSTSPQYMEILRALGEKRGGLTRDEIAKAIGASSSGDLTEKLTNLEMTGFIREYRIHNGRVRTVYQLIDFFALFNLRFLSGKPESNPHYFSMIAQTPTFIAYRGLTFELCCALHQEQIKKAAGFQAVISTCHGWYGEVDGTKAQIDMVFERKDKVDVVCECKFVDGEYVVDKKDFLALTTRLEAYRKYTNGKRTIVFTLVTTEGLKPNLYSSVFQKIITLDDLFQMAD